MKNFIISVAFFSLIALPSLALPHSHPVKILKEEVRDKVDNSKVKEDGATVEDVPSYPANTLAVANMIFSFLFIHGQYP